MKYAKNFQLTKYDQIFDDKAGSESVIKIPLNELHEFKNHPFKIKDDDQMDELMESIKEYGVLAPVLLRVRTKGGYEIISGHRRKHACEKLGIKEIPAIVLELNDDEAAVVMVDSNIQRENLDPSEKAYAYKMKMDHLKHRGKKGRVSADQIGEKAGDSGRQVFRYIRLTYLEPELLLAVDDKKINFIAGVELSYLPDKAQEQLVRVIDETGIYPSYAKAKEMIKMCDMDPIDIDSMRRIILGSPVKLDNKLNVRKISKYFPKGTSKAEMTKIICKLLEEWNAGKEGGEGE